MKERNNSLNICIKKWVQVLLSHCKSNVSKIERKEKKRKDTKIPHYIHHKQNTLPLTKIISYTNSPPNYMTTFIPKTTSPFCHKWQRVIHWEAVISSSPKKLAPSSSSASSLWEPSSLSSSETYGDGDRDATKPPMTACRQAIWPTQMFTWHNSSLRMSSKHPCAQAVP